MKSNKKTNTILLVVMAIIIVAILIYFYFKNKNSKPTEKIVDIQTGAPYNPSKGFTDSVDPNRILKRGDAGNTVTELQKAVNAAITQTRKPIALVTVDGVYGKFTDASITSLTNNTIGSDKGNVSINAIQTFAMANIGKNIINDNLTSYYVNP